MLPMSALAFERAATELNPARSAIKATPDIAMGNSCSSESAAIAPGDCGTGRHCE